MINQKIREVVVVCIQKDLCSLWIFPGLVDCYLSSGDRREALASARNAHKTIGTNARTLTVSRWTCFLIIELDTVSLPARNSTR